MSKRDSGEVHCANGKGINRVSTWPNKLGRRDCRSDRRGDGEFSPAVLCVIKTGRNWKGTRARGNFCTGTSYTSTAPSCARKWGLKRAAVISRSCDWRGMVNGTHRAARSVIVKLQETSVSYITKIRRRIYRWWLFTLNVLSILINGTIN